MKYENFTHTARQLQELRANSHVFTAIPGQHYAQFLTDISYQLLQKVCSMASQFAIPGPVNIYQKIGMVVLNYVRNLCSDWFGGSRLLMQSFRQWQLLVEPSPSIAIPQMPTQRTVTAQYEHPPEIYFLQGGKHQRKMKRVMRMRDKGEQKIDYHKWMQVIEEGRKRLDNWQIWQRTEEAAKKEVRRSDPMFTYVSPRGQPVRVQADLAAAVSGPVSVIWLTSCSVLMSQCA